MGLQILLALVPSVLWGLYSLIIPKIGGNTGQQTLGVTTGALLFAGICFPFYRHHYTLFGVTVSVLSGFIWAFACLYQVKSFKQMGVSRTMPITTGMQLIGTGLVGVLFLHELGTAAALELGIAALVVFVVGIALTSYRERKESYDHVSAGMVTVTLSSFAYVAYIVIIEIFAVNSFDVILPQAAGMVAGALLMTMNDEDRFSAKTAQLIIPGVLWAAGNLIMFYSNGVLGVALSFPLSQLGIIISSVGGMVVLHEEKSRTERIALLIGLLCVFCGVVLVGAAKALQ